MTVAGLIEQYNYERPNQVDEATKMQWLRKIEQMVITEIINTHEHDLTDNNRLVLSVTGQTLHIGSAGTLVDHMDKFDMDTDLVVKEPYDELYIYYLDQKIALQNNDKARYNAASIQFNNAYLAYQQYFNRTYPTIKKSKKLLRHEVI